MDLHVYRNSQDRWHDLRSAARRSGAVLATNAVTLDELVQRLTPDLKTASAAQRLVAVNNDGRSSRHAYDAVRELKGGRIQSAELRHVGAENLADILDHYNGALATAGLVDPNDRRWIASVRVAGGHPWVQQFERVIVHAIYDLNECEFALVHNLIEALPDGGTVILFNSTANVKPTQFAEWTWQRFVRDEALADKTFPEFCRSSGPAADLLERLFVWDGTGQPPLSLQFPPHSSNPRPLCRSRSDRFGDCRSTRRWRRCE